MSMSPQTRTGSAAVTAGKVIVVGNEKGGSGKSTTAMHVAVALLHAGFPVAILDLDIRQATLSRYFHNRLDFMKRRGIALPAPDLDSLLFLEELRNAAADDLPDRLAAAVRRFARPDGYLVIDTPGSDNILGRAGHSHADILITPINDSFVDLDGLGQVDPETNAVIRPGQYAQMVFEQKILRARREGQQKTLDWIVMRNRMGQLDSRNRRAIEDALLELSRRIRFRTAPGFSERVIFRELFLQGLTLMDLKSAGLHDMPLNMSHLAARQEMRALLQAAGLPDGGV